MLINSNQILLENDLLAISYETYHNRVEAIVTKFDGEDFVTLATENSFYHDSLGEVLSSVLYKAGYENATEIIDGLGLFTYDDE